MTTSIAPFVQRLRATAQPVAAAASKEFKDFDTWKAAAAAKGCKIKTVTRSKTNTYYQAILGPEIVGFFNTNPKFGGGKLPA